MVGHEKHAELAKEYRVRPSLVAQLVAKAKKNAKFMEELIAKQEDVQTKRAICVTAVEEMSKDHAVIPSVQFLVGRLKQKHAVTVKPELVKSVLTKEFHMGWRRIEKVSPQQNSERNLVLRQQWALTYCQLVSQKKNLLNVDESWVDLMDYRQMSWSVRGQPNNVPAKAVAPRLSLILGIDSLGNMYASLTQVNTDTKIMCMFIRELVKVLDRERPQWRADTVLVLDNATYHCSTECIALFKELRVPMTFSGPHSYATAQCELGFGALKSKHLNPDQLPSGKK